MINKILIGVRANLTSLNSYFFNQNWKTNLVLIIFHLKAINEYHMKKFQNNDVYLAMLQIELYLIFVLLSFDRQVNSLLNVYSLKSNKTIVKTFKGFKSVNKHIYKTQENSSNLHYSEAI